MQRRKLSRLLGLLVFLSGGLFLYLLHYYPEMVAVRTGVSIVGGGLLFWRSLVNRKRMIDRARSLQ